MAKICFTKKFKYLALILAFTMLVSAFAGCKKTPENPTGDVGSQINVVDGVYHEVYIEEGLTDSDIGLVVGLPTSAMKVLSNAQKIYDGENEVSFANGKVNGLSNKVLGSENNVLRIESGDKEYTLKYMYVTRAIRNTYDLSLERDDFPVMPWYNIAEKNSNYIFEMDIKSRSYDVQEDRIPTYEINGYFVLAADIDVQSTVYIQPGQKMKNVIKAGHEEYRYTDRRDVGFTGTFDGRGHTISNVTTWMGGLFGFINGGTIKNLALINASNYWQGRAKNIFADYSIGGNFENLYVKLQQQGCDNGDIDQNPEAYWYDYWSSLIAKGTVNAKNCVFESFVLERSEQNNTNYFQFIDPEKGSTYQNVHCVGSSPLSLYKVNRGTSISVAVTEKEMLEFDDKIYGDYVNYQHDTAIWMKYINVMLATDATYVELMQAPSGVDKHDTIAKFKDAMKGDSAAVQAFMNTGCWTYDSSNGLLKWKNS